MYQSMSGDSEVGNSTFEMNGGSLTAKNGGMFYTTNTESTITFSNVKIIPSADNDFFLRCTGNKNQRGWGTTGSTLTGAVKDDESCAGTTTNTDSNSADSTSTNKTATTSKVTVKKSAIKKAVRSKNNKKIKFTLKKVSGAGGHGKSLYGKREKRWQRQRLCRYLPISCGKTKGYHFVCICRL